MPILISQFMGHCGADGNNHNTHSPTLVIFTLTFRSKISPFKLFFSVFCLQSPGSAQWQYSTQGPKMDLVHGERPAVSLMFRNDDGSVIPAVLSSPSPSRGCWPGFLCWSTWRFLWKWAPASCGVKSAAGWWSHSFRFSSMLPIITSLAFQISEGNVHSILLSVRYF